MQGSRAGEGGQGLEAAPTSSPLRRQRTGRAACLTHAPVAQTDSAVKRAAPAERPAPCTWPGMRAPPSVPMQERAADTHDPHPGIAPCGAGLQAPSAQKAAARCLVLHRARRAAPAAARTRRARSTLLSALRLAARGRACSSAGASWFSASASSSA